MMLCRERAPVEEGRVEGTRVGEWNERGRDGTRHGRRERRRGGRKRASSIFTNQSFTNRRLLLGLWYYK